MTIELDLPPQMEERLRTEAASQGRKPEEYVQALVHRQLVIRELEALNRRPRPQSLDEIQPRVPTEPGKSWLEEIRGKWPGDETDEEIERALEEMS